MEGLSIPLLGNNSVSFVIVLLLNVLLSNRLLTLYNVHLRYVSPDNLGMPKEVMDYIGSKGIPQVMKRNVK